MGTYLNPGNSGFAEILRSDYVDKTELIALINSTIETKKKLTCISRPRRFGKSYAAQMLCAYYDRTCDSHMLFHGCRISQNEAYEKHLNRYHVISLDISCFVSEAIKEGSLLREVPAMISSAIQRDIEDQFPDIGHGRTLNEVLISLVKGTKTKVIFVIDEWDALIREAYGDGKAQERYLNLLRNEEFPNN